MPARPQHARSSYGARPDQAPTRSGAPEIMTVEQVAEYLQLNKLTVYKYVRDGHLPAAKLGKAYRIRKADVDSFLETQKLGPHRTPRRRGKSTTAASARPEEITVRPHRAESPDPRERELPLNPMEWVIRELH